MEAAEILRREAREVIDIHERGRASFIAAIDHMRRPPLIQQLNQQFPV